MLDMEKEKAIYNLLEIVIQTQDMFQGGRF